MRRNRSLLLLGSLFGGAVGAIIAKARGNNEQSDESGGTKKIHLD